MTTPALPEPAKTRWQPLRLGLVEMFRYDSEEFWFHDGHLLLRGNNGTGKSKVLSLTLPLLFDANLRPARVEPDGDPGKRMSWNLLLGDAYERRTGYSWIEFGRVDDAGKARYLTLGLGLQAVAARAQQVDAWFFLSETGAGGPRLGRDWWLLSDKAQVPGREALRALLAGHGQLFEQAAAYRRAVDERLFRLGSRRYDALLDTLIQLRQPQLSRRPDERLLSQALTEALPPLPDSLLADVAEAFGQLEELRADLERAQRLLQAVDAFDRRYRSHAGMASRRQARGLRQAQTGFDAASRALADSRQRLTAALEAETGALRRQADAGTLLAGARRRHQTLLADPRHADAAQLEHAASTGRRLDAERDAARLDLAAATDRAAREARLAHDAAAAVRTAGERLAEQRERAAALAVDAGIAAALQSHPWLGTVAADLDSVAPDAARHDLLATTARRRDELVRVRRRIAEAAQATERLRAARQALGDSRADLEAAAARAAQAEDAAEAEARAHEAAWATHLNDLQVLRVADLPELLQRLADWTARPDPAHPARAALHEAQARAAAEQAAAELDIAGRREAARAESAALADEAEALRQGVFPPPPAPAWRGPATRGPALPGAPLWQLVDFAPGLDNDVRAGLEAALLGAGLLDAWVTPDGALQAAGEGGRWLDAQWLARPARPGASLARWLHADPAQATGVAAATVTALLAAVACGVDDDAAAEAWVAPDGRFRLGSLAGAAALPAARHVGHAARDAARLQRLAEIAHRQHTLDDELAALDREAAAWQSRKARAAQEWRAAPTEQALLKAHEAVASAGRETARLRQRDAEADARHRAAEAAATAAEATLLADATDLRLPTDGAGVDAVERSLHRCGEAFHGLDRAVRDRCAARSADAAQRGREAEARAELAARAERHGERVRLAEEARSRLAAMESVLGQGVAELQRTQARAQALVDRLELVVRRQAEVVRAATEQRAVAAQQADAAGQRLDAAVAERAAGARQWREFAATGLLASGLAGLPAAADVPDPAEPWSLETALTLARRVEQALAALDDGDAAWKRSQEQVTHDLQALQRALAGLNAEAVAQPTDFGGIVVHLQWQQKARRPDELAALLQADVSARQALLSAQEQAVLENHLQAEIATQVQALMRGAAQGLAAINAELHRHPTSTGVRFRLLWQALPDGQGAPAGLQAARERLLHTNAGLWSADDRRAFGALLQQRIDDERAQADAGSLQEQLARALDYRRWHQFRVERWQDGQWRRLSGPASSGERALGLTVPLFAAVATFYGASPEAPRLILLDEAFAGIDDAARAHCMALVREFDLDFVLTSEREWGCYAALPGVAICQLQRREGIDAVHVSRWIWDGQARRPAAAPGARQAPADVAPPAGVDELV